MMYHRIAARIQYRQYLWSYELPPGLMSSSTNDVSQSAIVTYELRCTGPVGEPMPGQVAPAAKPKSNKMLLSR